MEQLKPCPFCGEKAIIQQDIRYPGDSDGIKAYEPICVNIKCVIYKADSVYYRSKKAATQAWNRRVENE